MVDVTTDVCCWLCGWQQPVDCTVSMDEEELGDEDGMPHGKMEPILPLIDCTRCGALLDGAWLHYQVNSGKECRAQRIWYLEAESDLAERRDPRDDDQALVSRACLMHTGKKRFFQRMLGVWMAGIVLGCLTGVCTGIVVILLPAMSALQLPSVGWDMPCILGAQSLSIVLYIVIVCSYICIICLHPGNVRKKILSMDAISTPLGRYREEQKRHGQIEQQQQQQRHGQIEQQQQQQQQRHGQIEQQQQQQRREKKRREKNELCTRVHPIPMCEEPLQQCTISNCHNEDRDTSSGDCTGYSWCQECQYIKPPTAHHCRRCGVCVENLDHHCLYTANSCIGADTIQIFLIFLKFLAVGGALYSAICIEYARLYWKRILMHLHASWTGGNCLFGSALVVRPLCFLWRWTHTTSTYDDVVWLGTTLTSLAACVASGLLLHRQLPLYSRSTTWLSEMQRQQKKRR